MASEPVVFWTHTSRRRGWCLLGLGSGARPTLEYLLRRIPGGSGHLPNLPRHLSRVTTGGAAATVCLRNGHSVGLVRPREMAAAVSDGGILLTVRHQRDFLDARLFGNETDAAAYARRTAASLGLERTVPWVAFSCERASGRLDDPRRLDVDGRPLHGTQLERDLDALLGRYRLVGTGPQGDDALSAYLRDPHGVIARRMPTRTDSPDARHEASPVRRTPQRP